MTADEPAVERIREALRGLRFGAVTVIVHEGIIVQVERTEKLRLPTGEPGRRLRRSRPAASERPT